MMTADQARRLTEAAGATPDPDVEVVLGLWRRVIEKAAGAGATSARQSEIPRPLPPAHRAAWTAAMVHLRAAGFLVMRTQNGTAEDVEVRWDHDTRIPPRGGSATAPPRAGR